MPDQAAVNGSLLEPGPVTKHQLKHLPRTRLGVARYGKLWQLGALKLSTQHASAQHNPHKCLVPFLWLCAGRTLAQELKLAEDSHRVAPVAPGIIFRFQSVL